MNSITKNSIYKLTLNLFNLGIPLVIGPYAMRVLGANTMGQIYYSETIYNYFLILSSFGLYQYGIRELSRIRNNKEKLKEVFTSLIIISFLASLFTFTIYILILNSVFNRGIEHTFLVVYSINIITNGLFVEWAIEALENYKFITIKTIIIKIIYVILLVLFVKNPTDGVKYVSLFVLSTSLNNIISFIYISIKIKFSIKNIEIKKHIKPLILVVIIANINTLFSQLDRFFLGTFSGDKAVAFYVLPQSIIGSINGILMSMTTVLLPRLNSQLKNKGKEEYISLLLQSTKKFFSILIPTTVGLFVLAKNIIIIYAGYDYLDSVNAMRIFSIYLFTLGIEYILTNQIIYINKKENELLKFLVFSGIINLFFNIILVCFKVLTPGTAILTTLIANIILIIIECIYIKKELSININLINRDSIRIFFISSLFIIIGWISNIFFNNIIINTIFTITISLILYSIYSIKFDTIFTKFFRKFIEFIK
ncbi:oligosaccharide flippase family protein [Clostridium perfringens]|uniref:oligosaccharide flippase family protein n=1 Tax=Clostridium perfringens TaxID=1502 RepID=UPI0018E49ED7|nr:oligosaccharide flippase family protein [Clostridium perfringens]MBI6093894.1 oligosaccharide flippase family protein [Clostridium perfringens]